MRLNDFLITEIIKYTEKKVFGANRVSAQKYR